MISYTAIIKITKDVIIPKGTNVREMIKHDGILPYNIYLRTGDELRLRGLNGIILTPSFDGFVSPISYFGEFELFDYICAEALKNGNINKLKTQPLPIFCISESWRSRILHPPHYFENYIEAKSIQDAKEKVNFIFTKDFLEKHRLTKYFEYDIFEWTNYLPLKNTENDSN